jgi:ribosomal protein L37E
VKSSQPTSFEVYCDRCRVSLPVGTRRCIHCGGPTSRSRAERTPGRAPVPEPESVEPELDEEIGRRRFVSPLTLVWIVLIAVGYLVRACSGEAP